MSAVLQAYATHQAALRRFIYRFTRNPADVDDILQDAFLKAFAVELGRPIEQPKSLLYRIAKHVALDRGARNKRWHYTEMDEDSLEQCSPEDEAIADETVMQRFQAIADLPPQAQRVYVLRRYEGLSQEETAAQLGIAASTVEKHTLRERRDVRALKVERRGRPYIGRGGRPASLSVAQRAELRLAFKGLHCNLFCIEHSQRLGVSRTTIRRALFGREVR